MTGLSALPSALLHGMRTRSNPNLLPACRQTPRTTPEFSWHSFLMRFAKRRSLYRTSFTGSILKTLDCPTRSSVSSARKFPPAPRNDSRIQRRSAASRTRTIALTRTAFTAKPARQRADTRSPRRRPSSVHQDALPPFSFSARAFHSSASFTTSIGTKKPRARWKPLIAGS